MTWPALAFQVCLLRLDVDIAEAADLELETRATSCDARAEAALKRLLARCGA